MPPSPLRLYMIPGTGTDYRMYAPQTEAFPDMRIPEWLPPLELKESLESYAIRLAKTIDTSTPFVLGGVSLGGMLAQQMGLILKPQALILIATCSDSKGLPLSKRLAGKLTRALPDAVVKGLFTLMSKLVMAGPWRRKALYAAMLREMPPHLVRWQSGAATEWRLKGSLNMPVFQIHGGKDTIIPVKRVKAQTVIPDGGHLINITHEKLVNDFIQKSLAGLREANPALELASAKLRLH